MKLLTLLISVIVVGATYSQASNLDIQKKYIRYTERVKDYGSSFNNQGIPVKSDRLSNNEGNIVLIYDESLPDSIQTTLLAAKKLWESKLPIVQPIIISVLFEPLEEDISMIADVPHFENPDLLGCPSALASQIKNSPFGSIDSPDGIIMLNSAIKWNCRFSKNSTSEYNLPTTLLRGIARCLGFGSSIIEENENCYFYSFGSPTYFDKLLYRNDKLLSDITEESPEMADFVKSNEVYARTKSQTHKIYAPGKFVQDLSLCYFDNTNSIMSYSLGQGNVDLAIDDQTSDILRTIGWDIPLSGLTIKCEDISDNGIGSSYESHTFSLSKGNENVSSYNWRFLLKNKQGNFIQISTGTSENFTIPNISSTDNFFVNINGDLEGRIECDYTLNGKPYSAIPFTLSLELKPIILSINDISIVNNGEFEFYLNLNVRYTGADYVSIEIEEEYNTTLRNYRFDEPYIAHIKTGNITNLYYSWITIVVSNKYGTTYETLEYAPAYNLQESKGSKKNFITEESDRSLKSPIVNSIILYSITGNVLFEGTPSEFKNQSFTSGIYLKEEILENGSSKTSKVLFK